MAEELMGTEIGLAFIIIGILQPKIRALLPLLGKAEYQL